jgi:hypothetical protein
MPFAAVDIKFTTAGAVVSTAIRVAMLEAVVGVPTLTNALAVIPPATGSTVRLFPARSTVDPAVYSTTASRSAFSPSKTV